MLTKTLRVYTLIKMTTDSYPADLGYRMPAEWEPHSATWLTWPHNLETWPGQDMAKIEAVYVQIIKALARGEKVHLLVNRESDAFRLNKLIKSSTLNNRNIIIYSIPNNDAWIRDYGPNFLVRKTSSGKQEVAAIEVNGQGLCITTEECLLNPNRNGGLEKTEMESYLKRYLGVREVIWCKGNLEGDDTDGHIDNLVRFVSPDTVLCAWEKNTSDPNHGCLQENLEILEAYRDANGKPLNVLKLPMPGRINTNEGRLPASYANFYIGNRAVLLPTYNHRNDDAVESLLGRIFKDREIVKIPCETFIWGLGAIHCVTQQQP